MKIILTLCCLLQTLPLFAQRIEGVVCGADHHPVAYANIGVRGYNLGPVSDQQGRFVLQLPDTMQGNVVFSHLSYGEREIPIQSLRGHKSEVVMQERAVEAIPVLVTNTKNRMLTLKGKGARAPRVIALHEVLDSASQTKGMEYGMLFDLKRKSWIREVSFEVLQNNFDSLLFGTSFYRKESDERYIPLMYKPLYVSIQKTKQGMEYRSNVSRYNILAEGEIYVAFEVVREGGVGRLEMPIYFGPMYRRKSSHAPFEKSPLFTFGFEVRGHYLD